MDQGPDTVVSAGTPALLCCDVWEHAYYLKYRSRRPDYLAAWWKPASPPRSLPLDSGLRASGNDAFVCRFRPEAVL